MGFNIEQAMTDWEEDNFFVISRLRKSSNTFFFCTTHAEPVFLLRKILINKDYGELGVMGGCKD